MVPVQTRHWEVMKPAVIINYHEDIGGVDLGDHHLHYYAMARNPLIINPNEVSEEESDSDN
jgi:hypothetical protein